jgi:hypothetical protein
VEESNGGGDVAVDAKYRRRVLGKGERREKGE